MFGENDFADARSVGYEMLSILDVFVLLVLVYVVNLWRRKPLRDFAAKVPGPLELPIVGNLYKYIGVKHEGSLSVF